MNKDILLCVLVRVLLIAGILYPLCGIASEALPTQSSFFEQEFWEKVTVALVSAVLAFIGSFILLQFQKRRESKKMLSYDTFIRKGLVEVEEDVKEKVKVLYEGNEIKDLYHVACNVQNTGNTVVTNQYLRFEFSVGTSIVDKYYDPEPERELAVEESTDTNGSIRISQRIKVLIGHRFFPIFDVAKESRERGDRSYDHKQAYKKAAKVQGLKGRQFGIQKRGRFGDRGKALQERLPLPEVWATRKDNADTAGTT